MPRKFPFTWCFLFVKKVGAKIYISQPKLWAKWVIGSAISDIISKKENYVYVQKVVFLDNFERIFEKIQSVAKLWPEF